MSRAQPTVPRGSALHGERVSRKALRVKAWLLGVLVLAIYVGFYVWNFVQNNPG